MRTPPPKSVYIGTSGFQYPEWKGNFYPADLSVAKMLGYYANRFQATESNYSFRRVPSAATIARWHAGTPDRFKFCLKAPQKITHFAKLQDCRDTVEFFYKVILPLDSKLGAVLFQLPPSFKKDALLLATFLQDIPRGMRAAFEFRHVSWFDEETYGILRENDAALCIAESDDLLTPTVSTADFGYLRLRREDYKSADIERWARTIEEKQGSWQETYVFFKHEAAGVGPKFGAQMQKALGLELN